MIRLEIDDTQIQYKKLKASNPNPRALENWSRYRFVTELNHNISLVTVTLLKNQIFIIINLKLSTNMMNSFCTPMILIYFQTLGENHGMIIMPRIVNSVVFMEFHKITDSLSF